MEYKVGQSVSGIVSGITDYGVFVQLEDGGTGMIHISKLSNSFVSDIRSFVKRGESVTATVISNENGKIALSTFFANSGLQKIIPPRGPRNVLCVVVVTKCACGTGFGCKPAATKPAICAISTIK